ncbi:MAG: 3-deoxy-8-phosphooctulonate synthase [Candidatus Omnitrophica bacterium]|nr:3-deoxy-8-phosphooctulonate synthase [Candidatus Omnitrophota bacterium]
MNETRMVKDKFIFIAGPCVIENKKLTFEIAKRLKDITSSYPIDFIFKASYDKANRTSISSYRGPGLVKGIKILEEIKRKLNIKILSDVHCRTEVKAVKDILDVIQIPAFLSRQTDLIIEAAKSKKTINIKKAQFMSPYEMKYVIEKILSTGNRNIFLTERGTSFGYQNLVVDFRSFLIMKEFGYPVIFDVTHSLQEPASKDGVSGGRGEFAYPLALGGVAVGIDGLFMEVHPHPQLALSDKAITYPLFNVEKLIRRVIKLREVLNEEDR